MESPAGKSDLWSDEIPRYHGRKGFPPRSHQMVPTPPKKDCPGACHLLLSVLDVIMFVGRTTEHKAYSLSKETSIATLLALYLPAGEGVSSKKKMWANRSAECLLTLSMKLLYICK